MSNKYNRLVISPKWIIYHGVEGTPPYAVANNSGQTQLDSLHIAMADHIASLENKISKMEKEIDLEYSNLLSK